MALFVDIIGYLFIVAGVFFMVTGSLGVLRMPEFFTRLHPAGIVDSFGAPLVLIGVVIQNGMTIFSGKIILLILFIFITSPTATHALAKAALFSGLKPLIKDKK
jgi:multicomponent Na+:H+ antiporter subunit G